jgi:hypothetical protein
MASSVPVRVRVRVSVTGSVKGRVRGLYGVVLGLRAFLLPALHLRSQVCASASVWIMVNDKVRGTLLVNL